MAAESAVAVGGVAAAVGIAVVGVAEFVAAAAGVNVAAESVVVAAGDDVDGGHYLQAVGCDRRVGLPPGSDAGQLADHYSRSRPL